MAQKVELRKRSNNTFDGNDNLMLPVTHVDFVLGLLDEGKLKTTLLPDSMLHTKRMGGTINSDTNFGNLFNLIKDFNVLNEAMYPGTYFISNGKNVISASTDHVIYYNDDSLNTSDSVELENGDHLFYVKKGSSERSWENTGETLYVPAGDGVTDLEAPYNTINSSHIFATESELASLIPSDSGLTALVTGLKWISSNVNEYNNAGHTIDKTADIGGTPVAADASYLVIPTFDLYDMGQESVVLKISDTAGGISYWKLVQIDPTISGLNRSKVYESVSYPQAKHLWGVVNNSYDLATATSAGLMSAVDKVKLNSLSNYVHPGYEITEFEASGVEVITGFESDSLGHVTKISTGELPSASTSVTGVVKLATTTQGQNGSSSTIALTPAAGIAMLKRNQDISVFPNLSTADYASLTDGAHAIIVTGSITI